MTTDGTFELSIGKHGPGALRVVSLHGRERLSKPFVWDVTIASRDVDELAFLDEAAGQAARLSLHGPAGARHVHGVVAGVSSAGRHLHERTAYRLRIVPRLAMLRHRRNSRIFQDVTTPEVISAVLREAGVAHEWRTRHPYPSRAYCVQYEETDLDFVQRLLAEVGVFYWFEPPPENDARAGGSEILVLGDAPEHAPIEGDARLIHRPAEAGAALHLAEHHLTAFHAARAVAPRSIARRDYDFQRPLTPLEAGARAEGPGIPPVGAGEVYEHHGDFDEAEAEHRLARAALEQLRRKSQRATGESFCPRLMPGRRFTLEEHEIAGLDGEYLVTSVEHRGSSAESGGAGTRSYENRFTCAPVGALPRPRRRTREVRQVMETAVVTGPEGQEIYTDPHGRIKVQFHWDREGKKNDRSSCWIRVAQAWAGTGWGFQFIPRVGMEVLVSFIGGDPDRPMIVGCVPNATHPPPYALPESKTRSGIKTESTPGGGGYNEIAFEDHKDAELLRMRAQRDLTIDVLHDRDETIGRDQRVQVGQHHTENVGGNRTLSVNGDERRSVAGGQRIEVGGEQETSVGGNRRATITGDEQLTARGRLSMSAGESCTIAATEEIGLVAGTKKVPADIGAFAWGAIRLVAGGAFEMRAEDKLVLRAGKSRVEIGPERVTLQSPEIVILGDKTVSVFGRDEKGPALHLTDEAELVASSIRMLTKDASVELSENADVRGKLVRLNCGQAKKPSTAETEERGEETKPFRVTLADSDLQPYARKRFELVAAGDAQEGTTSESGEIDVQVPKDAASAKITLWVDEYPTGSRLQWTVKIADELPAASTLEGLLVRLANLGYRHGTDTEEIDEETREGLQHFQRDHELPPTGDLDEQTTRALEEAHGN